MRYEPGKLFDIKILGTHFKIFSNLTTLQIDDHFASAVIAQLLFLQSDSSKSPIHMYINCPGGSVTAGLGIYDTMQACKQGLFRI